MNTRKFRCSIYVDIFIDDPAYTEADREAARKIIEDLSSNIPNSYVGGVATMEELMDNKVEI